MVKDDVKIQGVYLMWGIWQDRNNLVFQGKSTPNSVLVARVYRWIEENEKYKNAIYYSPAVAHPASSRIWRPPPDGVIKINTDASLADEGWVGLGVVARNCHGEVIFAASKRVRAWWQVEVAEAKAIVLACKLGLRFGFDKVIIESDCLVVTSRLSKGEAFLTDLDAVLSDVMRISSSFSYVLWSHVRREGNEVANNLAKIFPCNGEQTWENNVPMEISSYVLMDSLSMND